MRWFLLSMLLLATIGVVSSKTRPKRDLSYIKNLISTKLFGADTIIIQLPEIPKNESFRLFKIQGYKNVLLKVTRKPAKVAVVTEKVHDPVMVKPEVSIIGNYLGTNTQGQTLIAIDAVKGLVQTGILNGKRDKLIQEIVVPSPIIAQEIKYQPLQTKYSYQQKGENADMTYESYNNKDVIVTRTTKDPPLPQYIKVRLAEAATIGASPYLLQGHQVQGPEQSIGLVPEYPAVTVQAVPVPYVLQGEPIPNIGLIKETGYIVANEIDRPSVLLERNPTKIPQPVKVPQKKINNTYESSNPNSSPINNNDKFSTSASPLSTSKVSEFENSQNPSTLPYANANNGVYENTATNGQIVTKYLYKQMNHIKNENFTVVKVGEPPKLSYEAGSNIKTNTVKNNDVPIVPKDYIFVPPTNVDVPMPNMIPKTNNMNINNSEQGENEDATENYPPSFNLKRDKAQMIADENLGTIKTTEENSLQNNPIVVLDRQIGRRPNRVRKYKGNKGALPYTGGPIF